MDSPSINCTAIVINNIDNSSSPVDTPSRHSEHQSHQFIKSPHPSSRIPQLSAITISYSANPIPPQNVNATSPVDKVQQTSPFLTKMSKRQQGQHQVISPAGSANLTFPCENVEAPAKTISSHQSSGQDSTNPISPCGNVETRFWVSNIHFGSDTTMSISRAQRIPSILEKISDYQRRYQYHQSGG